MLDVLRNKLLTEQLKTYTLLVIDYDVTMKPLTEITHL